MNKEDLILRALIRLLCQTKEDNLKLICEIEEALTPKESNTEQKIRTSLEDSKNV